MEFCNTIVDSLIPMPQFFEATSGREYLIKDGCRAVISVAEPIGVKEKAEEYIQWDPVESTREEIRKLLTEEKWDELRNLILNRLAFGTAGNC